METVNQIGQTPGVRAAERVLVMIILPISIVALGWVFTDFASRLRDVSNAQAQVSQKMERVELAISVGIERRVIVLEANVIDIQRDIRALLQELARQDGQLRQDRWTPAPRAPMP